jgi:crotonobetaine/carnitine-CoA ligase
VQGTEVTIAVDAGADPVDEDTLFEVEAYVVRHPAVAECAAVGVPAEHSEDEVKVVVVPAPGATIDPAELIEFLIPTMPRFMIPRYVEVVDALPKTPTMRVRKVELREALGAGVWDREAAGVELPR